MVCKTASHQLLPQISTIGNTYTTYDICTLLRINTII